MFEEIGNDLVSKKVKVKGVEITDTNKKKGKCCG